MSNIDQNATTRMVRSINRGMILDLLRLDGPLARVEIAARLNMSLPTVMRIVDDLMGEDLVRPQGTMESTKGRPRELVEFNGTGYAAIGVDLGGTKLFGAVADLTGALEHEMYVAHEGDETGQFDALGGLCDLINKLLSAPRSSGQPVRGIGVGVPGYGVSREGVVAWAPGLGWRDLPLKNILTERFHLPVFIENDVNLAAVGEWGFGAGRGTHDLVCMAVGTGIGLGIIVGDALCRGFNNAAGEIGYLPPGVEFLGRQYEGFGALESLASGTGIANRARCLGEQGLFDSEKELSAEDVFAAARQGASWAQQVVRETVDYLSLAIASISALLNPEIIILGGGVARSADVLIEPILERLQGVVPFIPRLVPSALGYRAAVMGAIMLVLNGTTEHFVVRHLH